ncbi:tetratricopeptide repeat protein [Actinoplanes awajinensis]|uniref:Tetratrico peptide repeat group 5 domain-containing protein n=1 Tax=Actinoplanes awajinensis subsp. mycoplanecinus TaxID=135947 RepID=A0A124GA18_9ACTN|nr:hypothetical protein [Actinoplanes awajinensis]KUL30775.1 hypothetical protein ADL15_24355 [Actinoplanes awajinensis subsp. mycoplanecinus]
MAVPAPRRPLRAWRCPALTPAPRRADSGVAELTGLPAAVIAAHHLIAAGNTYPAATLLGRYLDALDIAWLPDDPILVDAFTLYATLRHDDRQLAAARYAEQASRRLHTELHPRRLAAARVLGNLLHRRGHFDEAITVRKSILDAHRQLDIPPSTAEAHSELAASLHAAGHCGEAVRAADRAWLTWQNHPGDDTIGQPILRGYLRMLKSCGRFDDLADLLCEISLDPAAAALALSMRSGDDTAYLDRHQRQVCAGRESLHASEPGRSQPHPR